jgi:chemotaxis protein histidine kinase CheA
MVANCSIEDTELVQCFVADSREMIDDAEPYLIELQQSCESGAAVDEEALNTIFRLFHSVKGGAGFLQLDNVTKVTHEAETLLNLFRDGEITCDAGYADLVDSTSKWVIRGNEAFAKMPIVIISSVIRAKDIADLLDLGATYFMPKPLKINELKGFLERHLIPSFG